MLLLVLKKNFQGMLCKQLQENTDVSKQQYRHGYAHYICCILHLGMQTATCAQYMLSHPDYILYVSHHENNI